MSLVVCSIMRLKIVKFAFLLLCIFCSCTKEPVQTEEVLPKTYGEMFKALNLRFSKDYSYIERINNTETGNKGRIRFSLSDTSIMESFNGYIVKDHFRLDSFQAYSCQFINLGSKKYNTNISRFINNANKNLSFVNGSLMVSFDSIENGSYYYYQYIIKE